MDFAEPLYEVADNIWVRNPIDLDVHTAVLKRANLDGTPIAKENSFCHAIIWILTRAVSDQHLLCTVEIYERLLVVGVRAAHAPQAEKQKRDQYQAGAFDTGGQVLRKARDSAHEFNLTSTLTSARLLRRAKHGARAPVHVQRVLRALPPYPK